MSKRLTASACGCLLLALAALAPAGVSGRQEGDLELVKKLAVPANAGWVDTGLDAAQGDGFHFRASGTVSLQRGNPSADCGPLGLDLITTQQPVADRNIGALVGKVAQLIDVKKDEDTGEEIRDEIVRYFYVGEEADVIAPIRGRLYLGVNENVFKDNGGEFAVLIYRRKG